MSYLPTLRKELHRYPETSGEEFATKKRILEVICNFSPDSVIELGKTGLAFIYNGTEKGKTLILRCELDALPIKETNNFEHCSTTEGKGHLCGHDGHMSIMVGVAEVLSKNKNHKGRVVLLFQPAEENGEGAREILSQKAFQDIKPDFIIALHNVPGFEKGSIILKPGIFTPSVISMIIILTGKTSHAAEPQNGFNPSLSISDVIKYALSLNKSNEKDKDFTLITPIFTNIGSQAYGTSAGYGETHFTIRTYSNTLIKSVTTNIENKVAEFAQRDHLKHDISFLQEFKANENDGEVINIIQQVALENHFEIIEKTTPFPWGEDFGNFTSQYKGAMFGLGAGTDIPALHNPDYDFPDEIIPDGIKIFSEIISNILD